ncbi:MAG: hypothetical protein JWO31_620 [Phycisphaerales bacterium]|nr:hypothetical protein [Phycisphaerales bacterium]
MKRRMVLPGGNGYLGIRVAAWFAARDWDVTVLSRRPDLRNGPGSLTAWDGHTLGPWAAAVDGADAVVNLAGRTVNCRYTAANRREIYASRLDSTRVVGQAIAAAAAPPPVWLNAASATIYRHAEDRPMDERSGELGSDFSSDVCKRWEAELFAAATPRTRRVAMRAAMVMGPGSGGVYEAFRRIARLGLGGTLGRGTQYVSWVHLEDFCRAVEFLIGPPPRAGTTAPTAAPRPPVLDGAVNVASPNPLANRDFMRAVRNAVGARLGLPATRWMLEVGAAVLRTETELLLRSRRVVPTRLAEAGFTFAHPDWPAAAADIERQWGAK